MKNQWLFYYAEILQKTGRLLVLPVLAVCIWVTYKTTAGVTFITREMPVITISPDGKESVVWAGGDMEPVCPQKCHEKNRGYCLFPFFKRP